MSSGSIIAAASPHGPLLPSICRSLCWKSFADIQHRDPHASVIKPSHLCNNSWLTFPVNGQFAGKQVTGTRKIARNGVIGGLVASLGWTALSVSGQIAATNDQIK